MTHKITKLESFQIQAEFMQSQAIGSRSHIRYYAKGYCDNCGDLIDCIRTVGTYSKTVDILPKDPFGKCNEI